MNTVENLAAPNPGVRAAVRFPVLIYAILLIAYLVNIMDRQLFSIVAVEVREALHLTLPQVGFASTAFTLGVAVAGVPTAFLLTKFTRKFVVVLGLMIFSVATWITAYAHGFGDLLGYRFLSGVGESMQFIAILTIATNFFYKRKGLATGALNFTYGLGAVIGPNLGAALMRHDSWQTPFEAFGVGGMVITILIVMGVSVAFTELRRPVVDGPMEQGSKPTSMRAAMSPSTWLLVGASVLTGLSMYGYLGLYPTFLRSHLGFTSQQAALASSFYGLGAFVSPLGGWLGDRFHYKKVLLISFVALLVPSAVLFTPLGGSIVIHSIFTFVFGALASGTIFVNLAAGLVKSVHPSRTALGPGLFVASLYLPASIAGYLMASLQGRLGWEFGGATLLCGTALLGIVLIVAASLKRK